MIFGLFIKKKPAVPVEAGEIIEIKFLNPPAVRSTPAERFLYARVVKVSKKRNIFINFTSKDKGEDLQVGVEGTVSALKSNELIRFPSKLLHREDPVFIFSPPETVTATRVPENSQGLTYRISFPVEYRAMAGPHIQKGKLLEFSSVTVGFSANLAVPVTTSLTLDLFFPYRDTPINLKGKVIACDRSAQDSKKHRVQVSLDEMPHKDKDEILRYLLLSGQERRET